MMRSARERRHEPRRHDAAPSAIRSRPCSRGLRSRRPRARWSRGSSKRSSSRRSRCCSTSWSSKRRSDTSAASRACAGPRSCRRAKRSPRSMKAACRRRWCVASTSSPRATSSTTRPMCLAFGLPGVGKSHAMCAVGHALVERGHAVLFMPTYSLVQELLAAKRNLELPRALRKLDHFAVLILDDVGLHPAESRGGRDSLHAPRRTLRATLRLHHQQSDLRAVGSDLPRSDGDGRGDRSLGASLGAAGIRCPQLPDRARETPRQGHAPSGGRRRTMNRAPTDRSCTSRARDSRDLCWRLRACRRSGADVLHGHRPADDNNRVPPGGGRHSFADPSTGRNSCR